PPGHRMHLSPKHGAIARAGGSATAIDTLLFDQERELAGFIDHEAPRVSEAVEDHDRIAADPTRAILLECTGVACGDLRVEPTQCQRQEEVRICGSGRNDPLAVPVRDEDR